MANSKIFRVAVEGATVDGRVIERDWLTQMAASYDPKPTLRGSTASISRAAAQIVRSTPTARSSRSTPRSTPTTSWWRSTVVNQEGDTVGLGVTRPIAGRVNARRYATHAD